MLDHILLLTKKFISIQSTQDNPKSLEKILELALSYVQDHTIERFIHNGVPSALVYKGRKRPKKFKIILNGHLDVTPGKEYQYTPHTKGNRLYGVGSMDMKANVACLIAAFKEVIDMVEYPLALQLVTDEEVGGFNGTRYQVKKGVRADFVLAGEPTNFDIVNKTKGVLWIKIFSRGKTAHGAYPWRGENAIWKMTEFLHILRKKYPIIREEKWITTINLSKIETSNSAFNKIPDDCTVWLDVRYIPEEVDKVVKTIQSLLPKGFEFRIIAKESGSSISASNKYVKLLQDMGKEITGRNIMLRGAHGSSDARHFTHVNGMGLEFGPIGGGIGSDDEWVDIQSLKKYYEIIKTFLLSVDR